jgi:hypothetical protein
VAVSVDDEQPQQMQVILPVQLPEQWNIQAINTPDGPKVIVMINGPYGGPFVHFIDRDFALQIASAIRREAQTGPKLLIP